MSFWSKEIQARWGRRGKPLRLDTKPIKITLEHLGLAFIILGFGLLISILGFAGEAFIASVSKFSKKKCQENRNGSTTPSIYMETSSFLSENAPVQFIQADIHWHEDIKQNAKKVVED